MSTKKNSNQVNVNVNNLVANYQQAHTSARSIKVAASTLNQARKALGGIANEAIVIGRNDKKEKIYTKVSTFMETVGCPYKGGQVPLSSIKNAWADYLKDKDGNLMVCKNVVQRTKIGKMSYTLYCKGEDDKFKAVTIYQPAPVRDNGWDPYKICEGLAQSKFIDEVSETCEKSKKDFDELNANGGLYVHDTITNEYVPVTVK